MLTGQGGAAYAGLNFNWEGTAMARTVNFFAGANSGDGFRNLFHEIVDLEATYDLMILKGGPGVGKNTFMREIGRTLEQTGTPVEYLWCSGDPDSLDGVVLPEVRCAVVDGTAVWVEQDEALVTHAAKIEKAELRLEPGLSAIENVRRVLASSDAAPARCVIAGKPVRIMRAALGDVSLAAGELRIEGKRVYVGCADGAIEILSMKPDGKREMDAAAWAAGQREAGGRWERLS